MKVQIDFKKEWPRLKKELARVSKEALVLAKKGEKHLVALSKQGKKQMDITTLTLRREHLYHLIGKEYVFSKFAEVQSTKKDTPLK